MKNLMLKPLVRARLFISTQSGATLVEYGVALIVTLIVGASAIGILGNAVGETLEATASAF